MNTLWQDLHYGIRILRKKPVFSAVAVITLSLGIGANTAIFSVVNAVLLRPLPFKDPNQLIIIREQNPQRGVGWERVPASLQNFTFWSDQCQSFEQIAGMRDWSFTLTDHGEPELLSGALISNRFFALFDEKPVLGRSFLPEEYQPGRNQVVILGDGLWRRRFNSDPAIIGQNITLNSKSFTVIGVLPQRFDFSSVRDSEVWAPLSLDPDQPKQQGFRNLWVVARLKQKTAFKQAQLEMEIISRRLEQRHPESNAGFRALLIPLHRWVVGDVRQALLVLFAAIGFVLFIACVNVTNLLLARATSRQKEMAIRATLGASRGRLVIQALVESLILFLASGAGGLLLAILGKDLMVAFIPGSIPRIDEIAIDRSVLGFTFLVSLLTGIISGLIPASQSSRIELTEALKEGGRGAMGRQGRRFIRGLLVVSEVAFALVLLIGAGLMIRSFSHLQRVDLGFDANNLLTLQVLPAGQKYPDDPRLVAFYQRLIERIGSLPGARSVGATSSLPLTGKDETIRFEIEGQTNRPGEMSDIASYREISPDYFRVMNIPLIQGRFFTDRDESGKPGVVIINDSLARRLFPAGNPVGQRLVFGHTREAREIVGVVGNVRHLGPSAEARAEVYWPYLQNARWSMFIVVRATSDPLNLIAALRQAVRAIDQELPIFSVRTMEERVANSVAQPRFGMLLLSLFAGSALVLAASGIYGVISHSVSQRVHEVGVRMALGAQAKDILKLVVGEGMALTLIGIAIGLAGAFALTRLMSGLLYGVSATDTATFLFISLSLAGVALLACYIPARRLMSVDPMVALRHE
jgi:putative ABC transport system permease protein